MILEDYVDEREGDYYVKGSRVSLASIIYEFRDGASPETIRQDFPTLSLAQVYGSIAFYLNNPAQSEEYLQRLGRKWEALQQRGQPPNEDLQKKIDLARSRQFAGSV